MGGGGGGAKKELNGGLGNSVKFCVGTVSVFCVCICIHTTYMHTRTYTHGGLGNSGGGGGLRKESIESGFREQCKILCGDCVSALCTHIFMHTTHTHARTHSHMYIGRAEWGFKGGGWKRLLLWLRDDFINFVVSVTYNYVNFTVCQGGWQHHIIWWDAVLGCTSLP